MNRITTITFLILLTFIQAACSGEQTDAIEKSASGQISQEDVPAEAEGMSADSNEPPGVVARVGDQVITFYQLNTMINSSPIVGLSMPELGSPERDTVRITLLDKLISANLLYLDALQQKVDQDPEYVQVMKGFKNAIIADLYRSKHLVGNIEVSDKEIEEFYNKHVEPGTEFTEEARTGIEAAIRKQRHKDRVASMRERLRKGHKAAINVTDLDPADDHVRSDHDVVGELDGVPITWAEASPHLLRAHTMRSVPMRIEALEKIIDTRIMTQLGREAGLEEDPVFKARFGEFRKTRLINMHRDRLLDAWEPTEQEIRDFYDRNRDRIVVKEVRKVQMLVVKTEEEAKNLKRQMEANEMTFHQAVANHSIMPDAGKTLGQIGWVTEDSGFPELDEVTFLLEAGEISGPVQTPNGWYLVRVLDQRDALHKNIADQNTQKVVRKMLLDEKLDQYVINLRNESFMVEIDEGMLNMLAQQEVDWYQEMLQKAQKSPEEVKKQIERLRGQ